MLHIRSIFIPVLLGAALVFLAPQTTRAQPLLFEDFTAEQRADLMAFFDDNRMQQVNDRLREILRQLRAGGFELNVWVEADRRLLLEQGHGGVGGVSRGSTAADGRLIRINPLVIMNPRGEFWSDDGLLVEMTLVHEMEHVRQIRQLGQMPHVRYPRLRFRPVGVERGLRERDAYQAQIDYDTPIISDEPHRRYFVEQYQALRNVWVTILENDHQALAFERRTLTLYPSVAQSVQLVRDAHEPVGQPVFVVPLPVEQREISSLDLSNHYRLTTGEIVPSELTPEQLARANATRDAIRDAERDVFVIDNFPRFRRTDYNLPVRIGGRGRERDVVIVAIYRDQANHLLRAELDVHALGDDDPRDPPDDDEFNDAVLPQLPATTGGSGETPLALPEANGYAQLYIEGATEAAVKQLALPAPPADVFLLPSPSDATETAELERDAEWRNLLSAAATRLGGMSASEIEDLRQLLVDQRRLEKQAMEWAYAAFIASLPHETQKALIAAKGFFETHRAEFAQVQAIFGKYRYIATFARVYYEKGAAGLLQASMEFGCSAMFECATKLVQGALGPELGPVGYYATSTIGTGLEAVVCRTFLPALFEEGVGESWLTGETVYSSDAEVNRWVKILYTGEIMAGVDVPELPPGIDFYYRARVTSPRQIYHKYRAQPALHEALRDHWRYLYNEYPELAPVVDLDRSELATRIWQRIYKVASESLVAGLREDLNSRPKPAPAHDMALEYYATGALAWPPPPSARPPLRAISGEGEDLGEVTLGTSLDVTARIGVLGLAGIDEDVTFEWTVEGAGTGGLEDTEAVRVPFPADRVDPDDDLFKVASSTFTFKVDSDVFEGGKNYVAVARVRGTSEEIRFPFVTKDDERLASCNSAVGAGSDEPETIQVDMGGFTGKASFRWEMYTVKDRMRVSSGGALLHDTGCVSGSDTVVFDVTGGQRLTVEVIPNCEGTSGTQWNFQFTCPAETKGGDDKDTTGPQPGPAVDTTEVEPNDVPAEATPIALDSVVTGRIDPRGDVDHYVLDLADQGELRVNFISVPDGLDMAFRVLDAAGTIVWDWQAGSAGAPLDAWADIKTPGRYVLEVRDQYNNAGSTTAYKMRASFRPTADPAEPNDTLADATPVALGQPVEAAIFPRSDADFYRVALPHQGQLVVDFSAVPAGIDMSFRVLDTNGGVVWDWQAGRAGEAHQAWADIKTPGDYVIEVRDQYNNARSPDAYHMAVSLVATADTGEPNDTPGTASDVALGETISANILPRDDADLYRVVLDRQGELQVEFSGAPPAVDMAVRVLDETGATLIWDWQAGRVGAPFATWADIAKPGTYLVEVRDQYNNARDPSPYTLALRLDPTEDPAEPNDTPETATPLTLGAELRASILPRNDGDYYAVVVPKQGELRVQFPSVPPGIDAGFRVTTPSGENVWDWQWGTAGTPLDAWADLVTAGTYLIEVRDRYNNARSPADYRIVTDFRPTADTGEPNNSAEQATPLGLGEVVRANILPRRDADFYRITFTERGAVKVRFPAMPDELDMSFRLLALDGAEIGGWKSAPRAGGSWEAEADIPAAGTYLLEVRDRYDNARSASSYTLQVVR